MSGLGRDEKLAALVKACRALEKAEVTYALGASFMLWTLGAVEDFHDFDVVAISSDAKKADKALSECGLRHERESSADFASGFFCEYAIDGGDFDLMADFTTLRSGSRYLYPFSKEKIGSFYSAGDLMVPVCRPEEWYVIYQMMPGREHRVLQLEKMFRGGKADASQLRGFASLSLPKEITARIGALSAELE